MSLIDWTEVVARYPRVADIGSASQVESAWIAPAVSELEGALGQHFTVPFSSNNRTAQDIAIDLTYTRINESRDSDLAAGLRERIEARIEALRDGRVHMVTSSGDLIQTAGEQAWSSTDDYHPAFGMGDFRDFAVSSQQIIDEGDDRGQSL